MQTGNRPLLRLKGKLCLKGNLCSALLALPLLWSAVACGGGNPMPDAAPEAGADGPVDTMPPQLVSSEPSDGAEGVSTDLEMVRLVFDEALDLYGLSEVPFEVTHGMGSIGLWLEPTMAGRELRLHLMNALPEGAEVTIRVGPGLSDVAGNATSEPIEIRFRTSPGQLAVHPERIAGPPGHTARIELLGSTPSVALDPSAAAWSSDDEGVATVSDDGTVTLLAAGTTQIRVRYDDKEASVPVVVHERTAAGFPPGRDPSYPYCVVYDLTPTGSIQDSGCDRLDESWILTVGGDVYQPPAGPDGMPMPTEPRPPYEGPAPAMVALPEAGPDGSAGVCALLARGGAGASQEVDLSGASTATLSFQAAAYAQGPDPETGRAAWKLVLIDASGMEHTLLDETVSVGAARSWQPFTADLGSWAGQRVRLRWVVEGTPQSDLWLDAISVQDESGTERFAGGDCSGALDPAWQWGEVLVPRELLLPEMELPSHPGVFVHRRIYAPYFEPFWIRYYDVVENRSDAPVTLTVRHDYELGPVNEVVWFPLHGGEVVVGLDGDGDDPGIALLLGEGYSHTFEYDEDDVSASWEITLEPGQRAAVLTYGVFLFDADEADPEDLARIEAAYEGVRSGRGRFLAGLGRDELRQAVNWTW